MYKAQYNSSSVYNSSIIIINREYVLTVYLHR